jgi:hypothetical protein
MEAHQPGAYVCQAGGSAKLAELRKVLAGVALAGGHQGVVVDEATKLTLGQQAGPPAQDELRRQLRAAAAAVGGARLLRLRAGAAAGTGLPLLLQLLQVVCRSVRAFEQQQHLRRATRTSRSNVAVQGARHLMSLALPRPPNA